MEPIFTSKATMKDLVRNPLGIVALFISLIYAFANLLLGVTVSALTEQERYPLIIFIVLFPVIVLCVFYRLVSKHHGKLYAPGDYKDDQSFLRTLSPQERQEKLEREVAESLPEPVGAEALPLSVAAVSVAPKAERAVTASRDNPSLAQLYDETRKIESAALAHLEREFGVAEGKDIGISNTGVSFDALLKGGEKPVFAEIKILRAPIRASSLLDRVLYNAVVADRYFKGRFKLILLVVYRFDNEHLHQIESSWRKRIEKCPAEVELRFIPFAEIES
jgi:hypothetical protein